jgi:hypothetical protein
MHKSLGEIHFSFSSVFPLSMFFLYPVNLSSPTSLSFPHRNLATVELFSSPILFTAGIHFPPVLLYNQGYPKVCPDPLNLPSTGDPFSRNIIVIFLFSVFLDQALNCFD